MGFVYILTNQSFREDWVKIGKTDRPVDVRSKELDNTAVPLPFDIYATAETSKYNELEKNMHLLLTDLADKRIRPNREFFNIKPEEAYKYLKQLCSMIDDAKLNGPDDEEDEEDATISRPYKGKYKVVTDEIFYLKSTNGLCDAQMVVKDGKYVVLEGSVIDPTITSNVKQVTGLRRKFASKIVNNVVVENVEFTVPSTAGEFVKGGACNGKIYWRTNNNEPLESFIVYLEEQK